MSLPRQPDGRLPGQTIEGRIAARQKAVAKLRLIERRRTMRATLKFWGCPITKAARERLAVEVSAIPGILRAMVPEWEPEDMVDVEGTVPPVGTEALTEIEAVAIDGPDKARVIRRFASVRVTSYRGGARRPEPEAITFNPRLYHLLPELFLRYVTCVSDDSYASLAILLGENDEVYHHPLSRRPHDCEGCRVARDIWGSEE